MLLVVMAVTLLVYIWEDESVVCDDENEGDCEGDIDVIALGVAKGIAISAK